MLIKSKEVDHDQVAYLNELLGRELPEATKEKIERELRTLSSGAKGEKDTAYYLDFHLKHRSNWALIHDLRIEHKGRVAQIDHILISRLLDIYVIESKHFRSGVSINDEGEFCYFYNNQPRPIESPIEQNRRHITVLEEFLNDTDLLPRRLGVRISPTFRSYILVSPSSRLTKPKKGTFDTSMVLKADQFVSRLQQETDELKLADIANIRKVIANDTLLSFAQRLAAAHKPLFIDYRRKFGLEMQCQKAAESEVKEEPSSYEAENQGTGADADKKEKGYFCAACKKPITKKVALFCFTNKSKFGGRAYCFECQRPFGEERDCRGQKPD